MKDLLSEVLLRKRFCSEKCSTTSEVLGVFEGLLCVLSKAKKDSVVEVLASVLSDAILKEANEIAACNTLSETDIGEIDADIGKSGKLDKMSDDCLRHAIGYLSATDRIEHIELTSRRMFHLSRSAPYGIMDLNYALKLFKVSETRAVECVRRLRCTQVNLRLEPLCSLDVTTVRKCCHVLQPWLTTIAFKSKFSEISQMTFPKLTVANLAANVALPSIEDFLSRHPSLTGISSALPLSLALLKIYCAPKSIAKFGAVSIDSGLLEAAFRCNLDLRKFTQVYINYCNDFAAVKPLLNVHTVAFRIPKSYTDTRVYADELQLSNLTTLALTIGHTSAVSLRNLNLKTSAKMQKIICTASLLDFDECLSLCRFGKVDFTAVTDHCSALDVATLCKRLMYFFADSANHKHESVRVTLKVPATDGGLTAARDFVQSLVVCADFLAPSVFSLVVPRSIDDHLQQTLDNAVVEKVKSVVTYDVK